MEYKVAILVGSENDKKYIEKSLEYFKYFNINVETYVKSAHRNPEEVKKFTESARNEGYSIIIGSAGMAAHLAGAIKANTTLPVIGVPLPGGMMDGLDSLLSTVQMPKGVPVATMSVGNSGFINAAILCAEIFSINDSSMTEKLSKFKSNGATI